MAGGRQVLIVSLYGLAGALAAVALPQAWPGLAAGTATALAAAGTLACALGHEVLMRTRRERELRRDLRGLRRGQAELREELAGARSELRSLLEALEAAGGQAQVRDDPAKVERISAEVNVLRKLVEQLQPGDEAPPPQPEYVAACERSKESAAADTADAEGDAGSSGQATAPDPGLPEVARDLDDAAVLRVLRDGLRNDRIDVVLQPIVALPQRKRRYYECFTRVRSADGFMILPEQYITVAERAGLVAAIDNLLLFRSVQLVRKVKRRQSGRAGGFFCNLSPASLADAAFMADLIGFLESQPDLARGLVFEIAQAAARRLTAEQVDELGRLARLGVRFSVDRMADLKLDPDALKASGIHFVKIEAGTLLQIARRDGAESVREVKAGLNGRGIDLVAAKIEDEDTLVELLDLGVDFGQGYLFGEPRLARP